MRRKRRPKRQVGECYFCKNKAEPNYKEPALLLRFMTGRGKILPASNTGVCARHQRQLSKMIKRARFLALVPYVEKPL